MVRLTALGAGRALSQKDLLVLIFVTGCFNPRDILRLEGLGKLKKFKDFIGTRTHDLPANSIAPQPSMLPRAPSSHHSKKINIFPNKCNFTAF
jgi:hypothetical protein